MTAPNQIADDLRAAVEAAVAAIRECRLADAHAARTGDEERWDRAFHVLCLIERSLTATLRRVADEVEAGR